VKFCLVVGSVGAVICDAGDKKCSSTLMISWRGLSRPLGRGVTIIQLCVRSSVLLTTTATFLEVGTYRLPRCFQCKLKVDVSLQLAVALAGVWQTLTSMAQLYIPPGGFITMPPSSGRRTGDIFEAEIPFYSAITPTQVA
jgi:hypothetical protein